ILYSFLFKFTFLRFKIEFVFLQQCQNFPCHLPMLFQCFCEDKDVINVDNDNSLINELLEDFIHHCLESCRTICQAKEHDQRFKKASVGSESSLPFISLFDANIIVPPSNIKLSKVLGLFQFVDQIRNEG
ncbi:hypothetical protein M422DRAFT_171584, partial [Sphaerobolus stellatus SS14]